MTLRVKIVGEHLRGSSIKKVHSKISRSSYIIPVLGFLQTDQKPYIRFLTFASHAESSVANMWILIFCTLIVTEATNMHRR
jgi:hypothetical protein